MTAAVPSQNAFSLGLTGGWRTQWRKTVWRSRNKAKQRVISHDSATLLVISRRWSHTYENWVLRQISRNGGIQGRRQTEGEGAVRVLWGRRFEPWPNCGGDLVWVCQFVRTAG